MLVVMHSDADERQVATVLDAIRQLNLTPHPLPGATRVAIGITGNTGAVDPRPLELLPGVKELISHMQTMPRRPIAPRWR